MKNPFSVAGSIAWIELTQGYKTCVDGSAALRFFGEFARLNFPNLTEKNYEPILNC